MRRGEIRRYRFREPDKERPVLILTRDEVVGTLHDTIVAPITRTVRGLRTEVVLTLDDGMPTNCAINFDHITLVQKARIGAPLTRLRDERWPEVRAALLLACGFGSTAGRIGSDPSRRALSPEILNELRHRLTADARSDGGVLSERRGIAWRGYLAGLLEWGLIDVQSHATLVTTVPTTDPDPVMDILLGRPD